MNTKYQQLLRIFITVTDHMTDFMEGKYLLFGTDTYVNRHSAYQIMVEDKEHDPTTEVYLQVMFPVMARMFADRLSGGTHTRTDSSIAAAHRKYESDLNTSKYAESVFGLLGHFMAQKPNISTLGSEAYTMFRQNKTQEWVKAMKADKQVALLATDVIGGRSLKLCKEIEQR